MSQAQINADFPYESRFVDVKGSRMHYIEEGEGDPILFLHGNPTSSYLWRNIIPYVTSSGRAIAPDLIGMGKSDKPDLDYRFADHVEYVEGFISALGLENITFVIHDWGSALGFHYASRNENNVRGLAFMESIMMAVPTWDDFPPDFVEMFQLFRSPETGWEMIVNQNFFVEQVLPGAIVRDLSEEEMNHYRAPYADDPSTRKPLWVWPNEVPIAGEPADVVEMVNAFAAWLAETEIPKLFFHAKPGAINRAEVVAWCEANMKNLTSVDLGEGIHFLQEDHPHEIGEALSSWIAKLGR